MALVSGAEVEEGDQTLMASDDRITELPETEVKGSSEPVTRKDSNREAGQDSALDVSSHSHESADQRILSGRAGKLIRDELSIKTCLINMRPEYARYLPNMSTGDQRELCVLSKYLTIKDQTAALQPVTSLPKSIPKLFLSASSQVLLQRIGALVSNVQPQEPIFQATQANNQPMSGFPPMSMHIDPMTQRGGNYFQGH